MTLLNRHFLRERQIMFAREYGEETLVYGRSTDYTRTENQAERKKLLETVVLSAVKQRIQEFFGPELSLESVGVETHYEGKREEINKAFTDPVSFVQTACRSGLKNYEASMLVHYGDLTEDEANNLIDTALTSLGKTRQAFKVAV